MTAKSTLCITVLMAFSLALCCVASSPGHAQDKSDLTPKRVLFIGNSYTAQIKGALLHMLANSRYKSTSFEFITKGGATLQQHLNDPQTLDQIKTGNWDIVVLQDQSKIPALQEQYARLFHDAVDTFTEVIRDAGAEPMLYVTWGRRDGDSKNRDIFPDYDTMQQKLLSAYRDAAERNGLTTAPVGDAWSIIRKKDKALGRELYKDDGSHPSSKGAFLASCVFFRSLFNDSLESVQPRGEVTPHEAEVIKKAALSIDIPHPN